MRIVHGLKSFTEHFPAPILTLGNFDGVHLGHQEIFRKVVARAREINGTSIAFTFEPHPLKVLAPERSPKLLNTFHAKMDLLAAAGLDVAVCARFTRAFADQHPEDFAREVLHEKIGVREVYVGYDYAFGKGREGSIESLRQMGERWRFSVAVVDAVEHNGIVVSSSTIREFVSAGKVEEAGTLLGRPYAIEGEVVTGAQRGQGLGFPTANLRPVNELLPAFGVYAVQALAAGVRYNGVASIGVRPTFDAGAVSVEVHLFGFQGDLYGKHLEVLFIQRLRGEERFADADALVRQIREDVRQAEAILRDR